ncbi:MAG: sigma 54-interacting transcriptional regulator [Deltaproteobacteria bacterium]
MKLLRAIDGGDYVPVGNNRPRKSDFHTIAATNRNLVD